MSDTKRLIESKPSHTAKMVCYMRALGWVEAGSPVANDYLAEQFLSPRARARIQSADERIKIFADEVDLANYSYLSARTRHLDSLFQAALSDGTQQIVLLGAGFDSRAYRFADVPTGMRVFEVDAPTTQAAKQKYLGWANITPPEHLTFVSINFNYERLEDVLANAGYDPAAKTLFIWEGVTYYISAEAVDGTLKFIHDNSAAGSIVAFDYLYEPMLDGDFRYNASKRTYDAVAGLGEPFIFGIPHDGIEPFLTARGYDMLALYEPDNFQAAYLDDRFAPMFGFMVNAVAKVNK